ncbi:MAG: SGNH/GDSL hydrolase family protein [Candidatus Eremiobacter antarcticus]|nr:SGNH/GDSL hydrolase family protein [Candidatus Eremiobacteraeota bacterium]
MFAAAVAVALLCAPACVGRHRSAGLNADSAAGAQARRVPPRILVFGDSLALGTGASDPARGFTFLLYRDIRATNRNARITNYAAGGSKVSDVLNYQVPRAADEEVTDVWLCVGANDVTRSTPPERFAADENRLLMAVHRRWPKAALVVFGVPDVSRSPLFSGQSRAVFKTLASEDDRAARAAAMKVHAVFVDLFVLGARADAAHDFARDNFHPNDRGYAGIARYARTVMQKAQ